MLIAVSCSHSEWPRLALAFPPGTKWVELIERDGSSVGGRKVTIEEFRRYYSSDNFMGKHPVTAAKLAASYLQSAGYHATHRIVSTLEEVVMTAVTKDMPEQDIIKEIVALGERLPEGHKWRAVPKRFASKKAALARYEEIAALINGGKKIDTVKAAEDGAAVVKKVKEKVARKARSTNGGGATATGVYKAAIKKGDKKMNAESNRTKVMEALWAEGELNVAALAKSAKIDPKDVLSALSYLVKVKYAAPVAA